MSDLSSQGYRNIKALVIIFQELDDLVIDACREACDAGAPTVPITEIDLCSLEDSRLDHYNSSYAMSDMLRFLEGMSHLQHVWQSAMLSIVRYGSWAKGSNIEILWKFRITQISNTGDRAWRLALPFFATRIAGDDTVNAIIDKFAVLDDALDNLLPALRISSQRQRGSDELRDTRLALVAISQATGNSPYQPPPTAQQIDSAKSQIRQRRKGQAPDASAASQPIADTPPTTLLPKSLAHNWNPTITAFVTIITMLAAIPGYKAWQNSAHAPGTVQDADFWILVQGSIMQLLALLTIIFTLLISSTSLPARSQPWFWTWGFVMTSLICSVSAVPLYLRCPTEWSQTVSFLGSAAQAFVILQAMFTMEKSSSNAAKNR